MVFTGGEVQVYEGIRRIPTGFQSPLDKPTSQSLHGASIWAFPVAELDSSRQDASPQWIHSSRSRRTVGSEPANRNTAPRFVDMTVVQHLFISSCWQLLRRLRSRPQAKPCHHLANDWATLVWNLSRNASPPLRWRANGRARRAASPRRHVADEVINSNRWWAGAWFGTVIKYATVGNRWHTSCQWQLMMKHVFCILTLYYLSGCFVCFSDVWGRERNCLC